MQVSEEVIRRIKDDHAYQELRDYLVSKVIELDSVDGLDQFSNERAGEEAKIRSKTRQAIIDILQPFVSFSEKKEPTADEVHAAKSKYAI